MNACRSVAPSTAASSDPFGAGAVTRSTSTPIVTARLIATTTQAPECEIENSSSDAGPPNRGFSDLATVPT
jgi:hypothetical protein